MTMSIEFDIHDCLNNFWFIFRFQTLFSLNNVAFRLFQLDEMILSVYI